MFEILQYQFMQNAFAASIFGAVGCGIIGVCIITLGIPFVGISIAHAAFAGAILGLLFKINPMISAFALAVISSIFIGPFSDKSEFKPEISIGIFFSFMLGIAFLGMGLIKGPKTEALNFLWGSILTVSYSNLIVLASTALLNLVFLTVFYKKIQAVLFNREIASSSGINEKFIYYSIIILCGITISANLNAVGGLLIFSLIINPPSAAYQLTYNLRTMFVLSIIFSACSSVFGLVFSYYFNVPSGAVIIITSSIILALSFIFSPKRKLFMK